MRSSRVTVRMIRNSKNRSRISSRINKISLSHHRIRRKELSSPRNLNRCHVITLVSFYRLLSRMNERHRRRCSRLKLRRERSRQKKTDEGIKTGKIFRNRSEERRVGKEW